MCFSIYNVKKVSIWIFAQKMDIRVWIGLREYTPDSTGQARGSLLTLYSFALENTPLNLENNILTTTLKILFFI